MQMEYTNVVLPLAEKCPQAELAQMQTDGFGGCFVRRPEAFPKLASSGVSGGGIAGLSEAQVQ